ncbi:MAG: flagellar biosynthetic protein FliO [Phycisphaerae bacterium]|nr:flagellar biosynthetic protein FliO [Phycisphaerae bacterium]
MSSKVFADATKTPQPGSQATSQPAEETSDSSLKSIFGKNSGGSSLGTRKDAGPDTSALLRQMLALVVIILVLGVGGWLVLKKVLPRLRMAGVSRAREISVLETAFLPSRQAVYLVQVGAKKLLLAGGREGPKLVADVTDGFPELPTDENFQAVLSKQDDGRNEERA